MSGAKHIRHVRVSLPLGGEKQFKLSVSLRDTSAQPGLEPTLC